MIQYIQIVLIALIVALPIMLHVKKARIVFDVGASFMIGVSYYNYVVKIHEKYFDKYELLFSIGPFNVTGIWMQLNEDYIDGGE